MSVNSNDLEIERFVNKTADLWMPYYYCFIQIFPGKENN